MSETTPQPNVQTAATPFAGFSDAALHEIDAILEKYPTRRAAILPVLWVAQREHGWLSTDVQAAVAARLDLPLSWVTGVATFYTMYYKKPVGRWHVQVCTNVSCMLRGSDEIVRCLEERLGIRLGETTTDGKFTLDEVECLASCGTAPMLQANDLYFENLDREATLALVDRLANE
jgi:NADH-quinone oxidoreductase subunit E